MGNNDTTPSGPDSLLGEFTKASDNRISETWQQPVKLMSKQSDHPNTSRRGFSGLDTSRRAPLSVMFSRQVFLLTDPNCLFLNAGPTSFLAPRTCSFSPRGNHVDAATCSGQRAAKKLHPANEAG